MNKTPFLSAGAPKRESRGLLTQVRVKVSSIGAEGQRKECILFPADRNVLADRLRVSYYTWTNPICDAGS